MPFFSIIVPTYNCANTLQKTLDSIASQKFNEYELIFMDGASTDKTLSIIDDFKSANILINSTLISAPDSGIYDAMNKGIAIANGEWLYFMGGDDKFYNPSVLNAVYLEISKSNVDLIYGKVTGLNSQINYIDDTLSKVLSRGIHHQSVFYNKRIFDKIGNYDLKFKIAADYHLTLKVFLNDLFIKRFINIDITYFGESGLSSFMFDYSFFSYHYKLLATNNGINKIENPDECLQKSIYCCLYLARTKKNVAFGWRNLWYYLRHINTLRLSFRIKTFFRMCFWSLKFPT
ncbi:glycosyltransferase family 2 protein [Mucilaginibacter segetis]|uniref:Glycosyltransferase n=1 Tax=Mucilaginibacter segetis TaxID=2793071 RepID=A0A934PP93_9SPHI|nr:glycosyltransferase family 2 protein [Mucilaginibacter segetis]MBK0378198.1 glycosyltransferase [Mucilaginibacter segetis]